MRFFILSSLLLACHGKEEETEKKEETGNEETAADTEPTVDTSDTEDTGGTEIPEGAFYSYGPDCLEASFIRASTGENGHWAAERMTLPSTPFWVESIGYGMAAGSDAFDYHVEIYVTNETLPGAEPEVLRSYLRNDPAPTENVKVEIELDEPLYVAEGESLVVAVEMIRIGEQYTLISTCGYDMVQDTTFWSNAADAPYSWVDLSSFGLPGHYYMWGSGSEAE